MKYKIYYSGILKYGYVTMALIGKTGTPTNRKPTIFNFKFVAKLTCWLLNKTDNQFNTYRVVPTSEVEKGLINPYDFMKFNFIKDCLFFGKKERFFIVLGVSTWSILILLILVFIEVFTLAKKLL